MGVPYRGQLGCCRKLVNATDRRLSLSEPAGRRLYRELHSTDVVFGRRHTRTFLTQIVNQITATTFELVKPRQKRVARNEHGPQGAGGGRAAARIRALTQRQIDPDDVTTLTPRPPPPPQTLRDYHWNEPRKAALEAGPATSTVDVANCFVKINGYVIRYMKLRVGAARPERPALLWISRSRNNLIGGCRREGRA
ncbi:hypothetical protein EVAR_19856_1 [Eumeta japonica]|uniref:Uncharacterized protein n=1 Tax=Eumeta variegata TaxID=151549 RepID=A0A4C1UQT9_EUMVA|nr:hypothetical protein EVAR_19856_1 [Eumeta japonica]